jgi:hypothetical protein
MKRIANCGVGFMLLIGLAGIPAGAQNQAPSNSQSASSGQSLGDYARQVRKAPVVSSQPKVFDNDNLPKSDKLSIVGKTTPPPEKSEESQEKSPNAANAPAGEAKPATTDKTQATGAPKSGETKAPEDEATKRAAWKQWSDRLKAQEQQVELLTRELDVLQREYQVRAAAMYADAGNRLRNSADWDKQDAQYKQQIADKQKAIDDAKQKLDDLREEARRAGAPDSVQEQ